MAQPPYQAQSPQYHGSPYSQGPSAQGPPYQGPPAPHAPQPVSGFAPSMPGKASDQVMQRGPPPANAMYNPASAGLSPPGQGYNHIQPGFSPAPLTGQQVTFNGVNGGPRPPMNSGCSQSGAVPSQQAAAGGYGAQVGYGLVQGGYSQGVRSPTPVSQQRVGGSPGLGAGPAARPPPTMVGFPQGVSPPQGAGQSGPRMPSSTQFNNYQPGGYGPPRGQVPGPVDPRLQGSVGGPPPPGGLSLPQPMRPPPVPGINNGPPPTGPPPQAGSAQFQGLPPARPPPQSGPLLQGPPPSHPLPQTGPSPNQGFLPPPAHSGPPSMPPMRPPQMGAEMYGRPPSAPGPPSTRVQGPPGGSVPPRQPARPSELPMPFEGAGQFHHQAPHQRGGGQLGPPATLTPSGSDSHSQRSSRAASPVLTPPNYDLLEGQFGGGTPTQPAPYPGVAGGVAPPPATSYGAPSMIGQRPPPPAMGPGMPSMGPGVPPMGPNAPQGTGGYMPQHAAPPPRPSYPSPASGGVHQPVHPAMQSGGGPGGQYPGGPGGQYPGGPGGQYPGGPGGAGGNYSGALTTGFNAMQLQPDLSRPVNLLQERRILPPSAVEQSAPNLPNEYKRANCSPEVMCCTLNAIPTTQSLLNKSRLPLGVLIHPFKDLALPVIQSSVIVRCRSCRTYINPFVSFVDARRWKCNLCFRVNDLPDEFNYDPVSKSYGEPQRRPEIRSATIEFIAPSEYMLRPPQPAVYLYLLDVSFNAMDTGYLALFCQTLAEELERLPGDTRTQIGFIAYDSSLYFFGLGEDTSQPQVMVVSDLEEVYLPCPDGLLVSAHEARGRVSDLLQRLPALFERNMDTGSALGPALLAAHKLMHVTGGRVTVMQTQLPTVGVGALQCREDPNERAGKKVQNLAPVTDFYKKLSLDCSGQQIAVDLFMLNSQYADIATLACVSKYSGGAVHYYPGFHTASNAAQAERYEATLRRYLTRKIGFEAVMRMRCTKGLSIHTFHGNFFVRSTDLLSLPNISPEAGFGMQLSIDDTIESNYVCFQAALLYTSSKAERRIRVHTLCVPVTTQLSEVHLGADQRAIVGLLAKMAVDKSLSGSLGDAREAMINSAVDMLGAYGATLQSGQRLGQLPCAYQLRLIPLYTLALLKSTAFRVGTSTKLDDRVFAQEQCKNLPLTPLLQLIHPDLYPLHSLDDKNALSKGDAPPVPQPPRLPLSAAHVDRHGAYLLDSGDALLLWVGAAVSDQFCTDVFGVPSFQLVVDGLTELPALDNPTSERLHAFIQHLNEQRPIPAPLTLIREDSRSRGLFVERLVEDRTESSLSYVEFLQHLQKEIKTN